MPVTDSRVAPPAGAIRGDKGPATSAEMWNPAGVALDSQGNLYIADTYNSAIRKVTAATGIITTVAGYLGSPNYGGDGGPATSAFLYYPSGVTVDSFGNLFIADTYNSLIREVNAATGVITTVAGNTADAGLGEGFYGGDGGPATLGLLNLPYGVAVDSNGNLFIADTSNNAIREVGAPNSHLSLPATNVGSASTSQNVSLYIAQYCPNNNCSGGYATSLTISSVTAAKSLGGLQEYTVGAVSGCVVDGVTQVAVGSICTVPITFHPAYPGLQEAPLEVVTSAGTFYFGLSGIGQGPQPALLPGLITTVAGSGAEGYTGDNGPATSATFSGVYDVAVDYAGNQYIDDYDNYVFRKVDAATGIITTFAGNGTQGYTGDNGPATSAQLFVDWASAPDAAGNLYIADTNNNMIREVNAVTGIIFTPVGVCCSSTGTGQQGYNGDGILSYDAQLFLPEGVAADGAGNIYIADYGNNRIREVSAATGFISTVAGTGFGDGSKGTGGYTGDNGPATSAELNGPDAIALDSAGNIYIADFFNNVIRKVTVATGIITTVAGDGTHGDTGDNGPATSAEIGSPTGLAVDAASDIYIAVSGGTVRKVDAATGIITTVAGGGSGCTGQTDTVGDGCGATSADVAAQNLAIDGAGDLYIADFTNYRSRKVSLTTAPITFPQTAVNSTSAAITFKLANLGNAPLTLSSIAPTANFNVDSGTTTCSTSDTVPAGGSCVIGVVFAPTAGGALTGTLTLADNALNVAGSTQQVALNGSIPAAGGTTTPTVTVTPSPSSITTTQADTVTVTVGGSPTPTGSVTLSSGSYTSSPTTLVSGSAMITIPAGALATGTDTLTATYTPDSGSSATYNSATGTNTVTVTTASGPGVSLSPNPLAFGGEVYKTTSPALAVVLSNAGSTALTGITPTLTGTNPADFAITTGTNACGATLAAGSSCNIWVTFTPINTGNLQATLSVADSAANTPQTATLTGTYDYFYSNVGTALAAQPVSVYIATAGTASAINVLTQGAANLDFTETSGGTCATGTAYTAGEVCTVNVAFNPQAPGARLGAALLTDSGGNVLGTTYLPGTGQAPEIVYGTGVQSKLPQYSGGNYSAPLGMTVDASLNVYVADSLNGWIIKTPWTGAAYGAPIRIPTGTITLDQPGAVAVDGSGNVFIADTKGFEIVEVPWNGSSYGTAIVLDSSALPDADGIAVDSNGNLFFTDGLDQKLVEMAWMGNGYGTPTTITSATGLHAPHGVAVDANLNVYIADSGDNQVVEIPWNGTSFGTEIVLSSGTLFYPQAVAVDAAGDVYIANTDAGTVLELPANGSLFTAGITGVANANGVAVDSNGNIYAADATNNDVVKLNVANPPSLSFASTTVGADTDPAQTVTVWNIGNASLYFNAAQNNPVYPLDFPINSSDTNVLCEEDDSVSDGASCDVSVNFKPTVSGSLSEDVVLTDNNLDASGSVTQSIPVSGTGAGGTLTAQAINFTQPTTPVTYSSGLTIPLVATGGASGNPIVFTIDGSGTGAGNISGSNLNVTGVGSFVIDANQAGNSTYSAAPQVQRTVVVTQASQTINFTQPTSPVTYASALQITLSATGGASGNPVVFTRDSSSTATGSINGSTLTVTSAGNLVIDANQAGSTNYSAATQVQRSITINAPAPDFTISTTQTSQTVEPGGSTTYPITVADSGGSFTSAVTLSVSGLPPGATGTFNPTSVTPGSESGASTLTVTIAAVAGLVRPNLWPMATPVMALLFMLPFRRWRRAWRGKLLLMVAALASLAGALSLMGCGGGFGLKTSQTYTLTITGTSGTDTHSTTVQLTVKQ